MKKMWQRFVTLLNNTIRNKANNKNIEEKRYINLKTIKVVIYGYIAFFYIFLFMFILLPMILTHHTIFGVDLSKVAADKYTRQIDLLPERGIIYDRNGNVLAGNREVYKLVAVLGNVKGETEEAPQHVVDKNHTADILSQHIKMSKEEILKILDEATADTYQVEFGAAGKNLPATVKNEIELAKLPGIQFEESTARYYPNGYLGGTFLGYAQTISKDEGGDNLPHGQFGLEKTFDSYLSGTAGWKVYAMDAWGQQVSNLPDKELKQQDGNDIHLTIDKNIQLFAENALDKVYKKYVPKDAFIIVANAKTGEILAMSQRPAFNPNTGEGIETAWINSIFQKVYEPGSTIKTFSLATFIENNIFDKNATYMSGSYEVDGIKISDWNKVGWGKITEDQGFQQSSNTLMMTLLSQFGEDNLKPWYEKFGFGKKTGILYNSEAKGTLLFDEKLSKYTSVFGQGTTVTPIQMIQAETTMTNRGEMLKPYFVTKMIDKVNNKTIELGKKTSLGQVISPETADAMQERLLSVLYGDDGTAENYQVPGYKIAGKTGTANVVDPETSTYYQGAGQTMQSFIGYSPQEDPQIIVYGAISVPTKNLGEFQNNQASELVNDVTLQTLTYLNVSSEDSKVLQSFEIPEFTGQTVEEAINTLQTIPVRYEILGEGNEIIDQLPIVGSNVTGIPLVILRTEGANLMPNMSGWSRREVEEFAHQFGISVEATGNGYVAEQSIPQGTIIDETVETMAITFNEKSSIVAKQLKTQGND